MGIGYIRELELKFRTNRTFRYQNIEKLRYVKMLNCKTVEISNDEISKFSKYQIEETAAISVQFGVQLFFLIHKFGSIRYGENLPNF